jgi:hypothetical protein
MKRQSVRRQIKPETDVSGGQSCRASGDKQAQDGKPCLMCQRLKRPDGFKHFHYTTTIEQLPAKYNTAVRRAHSNRREAGVEVARFSGIFFYQSKNSGAAWMAAGSPDFVLSGMIVAKTKRSSRCGSGDTAGLAVMDVTARLV